MFGTAALGTSRVVGGGVVGGYGGVVGGYGGVYGGGLARPASYAAPVSTAYAAPVSTYAAPVTTAAPVTYSSAAPIASARVISGGITDLPATVVDGGYVLEDGGFDSAAWLAAQPTTIAAPTIAAAPVTYSSAAPVTTISTGAYGGFGAAPVTYGAAPVSYGAAPIS